MNEPLLTESFLNDNLVMKDFLNDDEQEKEEENSSNNMAEEKLIPVKKEKEKINLPVPSVDMIEEVLAPEIESSKNYYKFIAQSQDHNNILDDGYESNLPFHGFF
jgi:hypothetical protein